MRRVFDLAWAALLVLLAATWPWMPEMVGEAHKALPRDRHMGLMLALAVFSPWLATRGALLLARRATDLVNLPHRDHWMAPERRDETLADLGERLAALGLGIVLLLAGLHYEELQRANPAWPQVPGAVWWAGAAALALGFACWVRAMMRRFGRLPPVAAAPPARRSSRNRDLVWREAQTCWPLLLVLLPLVAGLGLFASTEHRAAAGLLPVLPLALLPVLGRMVTEVYGDRLVWRFGWLPWPRWQVALDDIVTVETARSRWIEGWGLRFTSDGMLYNASGTQAVRLLLRDGRRLRLGSQAPDELQRVLRRRVANG